MGRLHHFMIVSFVGFLLFSKSTKGQDTNDGCAQFTPSNGECEVCALNNEVDELKLLLNHCQNELQIIQEKFSTQEGVQSSSALSYLGNMCSWVTSVGTRSSPLHLIVNQFLQNLQIDEQKSIHDIQDIHEVDVRYFNSFV